MDGNNMEIQQDIVFNGPLEIDGDRHGDRSTYHSQPPEKQMKNTGDLLTHSTNKNEYYSGTVIWTTIIYP